jgi:hypothetical protein
MLTAGVVFGRSIQTKTKIRAGDRWKVKEWYWFTGGEKRR